MRWGAAAAVLLIVVVASLALNVYQYASPKSLTVTTTAATTTGLPSATCLNLLRMLLAPSQPIAGWE